MSQDKSRDEFIMLVTHELKGPLIAIQGILEVMLKGYVGDLNEKQEELLNRIYDRIESLMELSAGLTDLYQWRFKRPGIKITQFSLKEEVQKAVDLFRANALQKGLSFNFSLPDEDVVVAGAEEGIQKILQNLITNAIKYTTENGSIYIGLYNRDDHSTLEVRDTGIGIGPEDVSQIFDEFFRAKEAKQIDPHGRGLGLSFVKDVVDSMGGTIEVKSEQGKGTEFILMFPKR